MSPLAIDLSRTPTGEGPSSPSPRTASISLQAAATLNAGLQREQPSRRSSSSSVSRSRQSPSTGRRRSQVLMNLQIADPSIPAPGEMVSEHNHGGNGSFRAASPQPITASPRLIASQDSRHFRTPSLGELHQELENEQEFQVNRLLVEIRRLQQELLRTQQGQSSSSPIAGEEASDRAAPLRISSATSSAVPAAAASSSSLPRSPGFLHHPRSSFDMARVDLRRRSRTPSRGASPRLRATSISGESSGDQWVLGGRDESAFYQAETQMLIRENQMLRHRIRDLERQLSEVTSPMNNVSVTHEPSHASHLNHSTSVSEEESSRVISVSPAAMSSTPAETPKDE
ncbi:hypothetical protein B0H63DRAFT_446568 [Podospora didyma]|uniref:Uncharacterized protein n=1 Tax=Podospora didyma TaxID=330526 RepID=A0AAE0NZC9_9PEZI|nr:hypothetical protein B0H63DRAFT_446568 [Podospora didyma]